MPRCLEKNPCKTCWKDWSCLPKNLGVLGRMSGPIVQSCSVWKFHQDTASGISEIDRNPKPRLKRQVHSFRASDVQHKLVASCTEMIIWHSIEAPSMAGSLPKNLPWKKIMLPHCQATNSSIAHYGSAKECGSFKASRSEPTPQRHTLDTETYAAAEGLDVPWHHGGRRFPVSSPDGSPNLWVFSPCHCSMYLFHFMQQDAASTIVFEGIFLHVFIFYSPLCICNISIYCPYLFLVYEYVLLFVGIILDR